MTRILPHLGRHLPKLISLLLATVTWLVVSSGQERVGTFPGTIPIRLEQIPSGLTAMLEQSEVSITVVAERGLWSRFSADSFRATLDLGDAQEGVEDRLVRVTSLVPGVQITRVKPEHVLVRLEPEQSKSVPVTLGIAGQAADGFAPGQAMLDPAVVTVRGPQSVLDRINQVLATVQVAGERQTVEQTVPVRIDVGGSAPEGVTVAPSSVRVTLPIARAANVRTVGVTVATTGSPPAGFEISSLNVAPSVVTVTGSPTSLSALTAVSTEPIALGELRETSQVTTTLALPDGIQLLDAPASISVTIQVQRAVPSAE